MIKAGEALHEDPAFRMNWKGAQGRPREAYWFFRQNVNAIVQAQKFLSIILDDWTESDLATADWETTDGIDLPSCLRNGGSFLYEVEKILGKPPAICTFPAYWKAMGGETATSFKHYPLHVSQWPLDNWIANLKLPPYSFNKQRLADFKARIESGNLKPMNLLPWGNDITVWQFTARAWTKDIPGHPAIKLVADMNVILKPWWTGIVPPPIIPPVIPSKTYFVNIGAANVRAGPSSANVILGTIAKNTRVMVDITTGEYSHFLPQPPYLVGAWIYSRFLTPV
jgi:hypothetical protein